MTKKQQAVLMAEALAESEQQVYVVDAARRVYPARLLHSNWREQRLTVVPPRGFGNGMSAEQILEQIVR